MLGLQVLQIEQDLSTKRNAFQMLCNHAQGLAVNYLLAQVNLLMSMLTNEIVMWQELVCYRQSPS